MKIKITAIAAGTAFAAIVSIPYLRPLFEVAAGPGVVQIIDGAEELVFNLLFIAGAVFLAGRWPFARWEQNLAIAAEVREIRAGK
jgi:hypothetical protein